MITNVKACELIASHLESDDLKMTLFLEKILKDGGPDFFKLDSNLSEIINTYIPSPIEYVKDLIDMGYLEIKDELLRNA